ncbi:OmpA family protein [Limnohabitans sp.]|uniref:OmpA family protein n=1 Tax=Limnohabitans sp. TaxID=1907725 RepID=UPI003340890F
MHYKHIQRAPLWQVVIAVILCIYFAKWAPAQTLDADTPPKTKPKFNIAQPLGDKYAAATRVVIQQARLVIYRPRITSDKAGVISVYINDKYHTSLLQDAYTVVCFDATQAQLRTRLINAQGDHQTELDNRNALGIKRGESVFVRVTDLQNGKTRMDIVSEKTADPDISQARLQKHAISRVPDATPCQQENLVITMGSDVIFDPKETKINDEGTKELSQIVNQIKVKYKSFDHVKVHMVGYADDLTEEHSNQRIALERAQAVRTYFISNGLQAEALTLEARALIDKNNATGAERAGRRVEVAVAVEIR